MTETPPSTVGPPPGVVSVNDMRSADETMKISPPSRPDVPVAEREEAATPLGAAVEATTGWLKKVSYATTARVSSAYAAAARSDSEEAAMAAASMQAPPVGMPPPVAGWPAEPVVAPPVDVPAPVVGPTIGSAVAQGNNVGPRRVRLVMARVDPWSAMKLSFLMSFALGIMSVIAAAAMWLALDGLQVFAKIEDLVSQVTSADGAATVMSYFGFGKVLASAMLVGVIDVFLITALGTIAAFLYNIVAALVGGLHVSVTDE
ncbi:MAG: DUF3566 domain-containing protein [Micrococcales bacterium]|nr:DUF3566 domain-containing protein [Micrococcales bacterium]